MSTKAQENMKNQIKQYKNKIVVYVAVALWKEAKSYIAYCPALDISAYGDNPDEAVYSFKINLKIFLEGELKKGTLERMLLNLGWNLQQRPKANYIPPKVNKVNLSKRMGLKPEDIFTEKITIPFIESPHAFETACNC